MSGTLRVGTGYPAEGNLMRGLMSRFFSNDAIPPDNDPPRPVAVPPSWRDEKIEDPFDDLNIRQRMAELIVRAALREQKAAS